MSSLHAPTLLDKMSADSLVPRGPEPVMDRVVANELPNAQMGACGGGHIPLPPLQLSSQRCTYGHRRFVEPLDISLESFHSGICSQSRQDAQSAFSSNQ